MTASLPFRPQEALAPVADAIRSRGLRVHAITSPVAAERTANTLLALGVRPTLTVDPDEMDAFVAASDALLINLGMLDATRLAAIPRAIAAARRMKKPWVLDPVFVDVSDRRRAFAQDCLRAEPAVLKTNAAETFLSAQAPSSCIRVSTGKVDRVAGGARSLSFANGHPLAAQVTAMGCALGAVIAAATAATDDPFLAAAAAVALYGVAGDRAGDGAPGPGSFAVRFYDALSGLDGATVTQQMRVP